ncbi:MAG: mercuric reductase [Gemmataceae bacterium]
MADAPLLLPDDAANRALLANVRPADWEPPKPAGRYNLVVLGGGTAGLVTAAIAAGLGARVALVEKHLLGGDCLNTGCVPSKAILRAARAWAAVRSAAAFGVDIPDGVRYDFGAVMARMRRLRAELSGNDSVARFRALGVDVFLGAGRFIAPDAVLAGDRPLRFVRAAICTGSRPAVPPIPGLAETGYRTSETVFRLTELPRRLAVIGGGPIGCEVAQAFARFGAAVTLLERSDRLLPRDDPDAGALLVRQLCDDGVHVVLQASIAKVRRRDAEKEVLYRSRFGIHQACVDEILVAAGRTANVDGLCLGVAGVAFDRAGVRVDDGLRTTNPRVYAAGDVCSEYRFTHVADAMAQIVIQNALFPHPFGLGRARMNRLLIPWCTYTSPEVAHVGLTAEAARARGMAIETYTVPLAEVDRAVLDGDTAGFVRVHVRAGTDRLVGATVVAAHAGELVSELTALMNAGKGLSVLSRTIHPYPTQADALRRVAIAWRKTQLTGRKKAVLSRFFRWMRGE